MAFHHRHLPTVTKFTKLIVWKWMHLYWPMAIHYLTDKYEGRLHHLIVDTIYAVVSFILLAANVGLGIWFYLYFTPVNVELHMAASPSVRSGEVTTVYVHYANYGRRIDDARIVVTMPEGFLLGSGDAGNHQVIEFELGDIPAYTNGSFEVSGVVYGNIGETYLLYGDMVYTYFGKLENVREADRFFINDSAFEISAPSTRAATYNQETEIAIAYTNTGRGAFDSGRMVVDLPEYFLVSAAEVNGVAKNYPADTRDFSLGRIEPHQRGELRIRGIFSNAYRELGDQNVQFRVTPYVSVRTPQYPNGIEFEYASQYGDLHIITPYVDVDVYGEKAEVYGNIVEYTVIARNKSSQSVSGIDLRGRISGAAARVGSVRIDGISADHDGVLIFPRIEMLAAGESRAFRVSVPTQYVDQPQQTITLTAFGEAFSPFIQKGFDLYAAAASTRFASQLSIASTALYWGPNGEQLGYGPYPPQAWNVTAYRVFLRVDNGNQPVQNVTVTTTLPGMTTWTGSYSTSTGTLTYDEATRTVRWTIPSLAAHTKNLGAQFEVRFLPNHLQIGLRPHIINDIFGTAYDPFAGMTVRTSRGSVNSDPILP